MIHYILKKDLPDVKAGAMFEMGAATDAYYLTSDKTETKYNCYCYPISFVQNNSEWFERFETVENPSLGLMPFWLPREE